MRLAIILFGILLSPFAHSRQITNVQFYYNCAESEKTICTKIVSPKIDDTNFICYEDVVTGAKVCKSDDDKPGSLLTEKKTTDEDDCYEDLVSGEKACLSGDRLAKSILIEKKHIEDGDESYNCSYFKNLCTQIESFEYSQKNYNRDCHIDTIKIERVNGQDVEGWILPGHHDKLLLSEPKRSNVCKLLRR